MNPLTDAWARLTALMKEYGLDIPAPGKLETPVLRVPVIGPFSAGKSSLLNVLAGMDFLPVGITATTLYPTELRHGKNAARIHRDGMIQAAEPGALRRLDPDGVTRVEAACDLPFLRQIPGLVLVDTPGLDSTAAQETLLREELKACGGCILIFPADDPVMKPGTAAALANLPTGAPVLAFLNKCDKLLPDELDASAEFLRATLKKLPGLGDVPVGRLSARKKEVEPLREALLALQSRPQPRNPMARTIRREALSLRRYLCLRLEAKELIDSSAEERSIILLARLNRLRQSVNGERTRFEAKLKSCLQRMDDQLTATLNEIALPLETMLGGGKDPTRYVEDFFRELVTSCYQRDFLPDAKSYLRGIGALMRLQKHSEAFEPVSDGDLFPPSALDLRLGDNLFPGAADLLSQTLMSLNCLTRSKKREAAKRAAASLLPHLRQIAREAAAQILLEQAGSLRREAEKLLRHEEALTEKAFAPSRHTKTEEALRADLETLDALLASLPDDDNV